MAEKQIPKNLPDGSPPNFEIVNQFKGYRNREDPTNLLAGILVHGSINVLTNLADRLSVRKGYTLFGQTYTDTIGVRGAYDLLDSPTSIPERHLKTWDVNIQALWRGYDDTADPEWITIWDTANFAYWNFSNFWDGDTLDQYIVGVNGDDELWVWNTAIAGFASATANTITKQGVTTWAEEGFDAAVAFTGMVDFDASPNPIGATITGSGFVTAGFKQGQTIVVTGTVSNNGTYVIATVTATTILIVASQNFTNEAGINATITFKPMVTINGTDYSYTGGTGTTTLTGVTPNPATPGYAVGTMVFQTPHTYDVSMFYGMTLPTLNTVAVSASQIYLGSEDANQVFWSKTNSLFDYTMNATVRLAGDGGSVMLDSSAKALLEQDGNVYISSGKNQWSKIIFTQSNIDVAGIPITTEIATLSKIKTSQLNGAISQGAAIAVKNNFAYLGFSKKCLLLGKTQFQQAVQTSFFNNDVATDLSYPVLYDFQDFDYTDASIFYDAKDEYILVSFPRDGRVMIYNQSGTDENQYWESPQLLTVGRFATIDGETYFHDYSSPTTYKLFDGYNDNGGAILARAQFSFMSYGKRANKKKAGGMWAEGYIRSNTKLYMTSKFEQVGCGESVTKIIDGASNKIVCIGSGGLNPIGRWGQGQQGIGSVTPLMVGSQDLPPAFQVQKTHAVQNFLKQQFIFESNGIDQAWELVAFGSMVTLSDKLNVEITE